MQIAKSKGVEDICHMEEKLKEMGRELSALRDREALQEATLRMRMSYKGGSCRRKRLIWHTWIAYP